MTDQERLLQIMSDIPESTRRHVRKSIDLADRISMVLESQGKTQKDLAKALGKAESEISKWLGGQHNFTIRTLTAIEDALGENIFVVPGGKRQEKYYPSKATQADMLKKTAVGQLRYGAVLAMSSTLISEAGFVRRKAKSSETELVILA